MAAFYLTEKEKEYLIQLFIRDPTAYHALVDVLVYKIGTGQINQPRTLELMQAQQQLRDGLIAFKKANRLQPGQKAKERSSNAATFRRM